MDTHKSDFLAGLSYFWNSWAVKKNIVVVICGSAASWMIQKILRSRGGLHNRVTKRIRLHSFSLVESVEFLKARGIELEHYQMLQIHMVMGGIPHYLKEILTIITAPGLKSSVHSIGLVDQDFSGVIFFE